MAFDRIAVVGAGAWGTALANVIARAGRTVLLAARDRAGAEVLVDRRESPRLPGVRLDERVGIAAMAVEVGRYDAILLAVPSQQLRSAARTLAPELRPGTPVIACAKGIERGTHRFMSEGIAETAPAARPETLTGLSGLGDVILTCSSAQSRNYSYGLALGRGDAARPGHALAEGIFTAPVLVEMAKDKGIDMPIAGAVADILTGRASVDEATETLLTRPFRAEG